tara:strand:- start:699 stop:1895 length:1197 start_codon:yes stop_codon:yes gene_type:complete
MKKILITGGPVHAYLDDVKIITNKFKGGLMADLTVRFLWLEKAGEAVDITYLASKDSHFPDIEEEQYKKVVHSGIYDYMEKVLELAPDMDAVILGAAVANLIPKNKIDGKFPSHNYKEGDTIPIDFTIAPRIIDRVKEVAPKTHLFGFKLLSGVEEAELIRAAYGIVLESKATAVIGNDAQSLLTKYIITKERGVHRIHNNYLAKWIMDMINDEYYKTVLIPRSTEIENENPNNFSMKSTDLKKFLNIIKINRDEFITVEEGLVFGTVALRCSAGRFEGGFLTTCRGKKELEGWTYVQGVDHNKREVYVRGEKKASLNAPLLHSIFKANPEVKHIIHHHKENLWIENRYEYAPPGTVRDSVREGIGESFNVKNHGCFLLYDKDDKFIGGAKEGYTTKI